jgi:hypothetical protein
MKMLRKFINPAIANEVALDRPADGWPEKIFRFSLFYVAGIGALLAILRFFLDTKTLESDGGPIGAIVGGLFGLCCFYMLNYAAWRYVKSKLVRVAWWGLMGFIVLVLVVAWLTSK